MAGRKGVETVEPNDYDQSLSSASLNLSVKVLSIPLQIGLFKGPAHRSICRGTRRNASPKNMLRGRCRAPHAGSSRNVLEYAGPLVYSVG